MKAGGIFSALRESSLAAVRGNFHRGVGITACLDPISGIEDDLAEDIVFFLQVACSRACMLGKGVDFAGVAN